MSMVTCADCGSPFDSDDDPGAFVEYGAKYDGENWRPLTVVLCENCRDEDDEQTT